MCPLEANREYPEVLEGELAREAGAEEMASASDLVFALIRSAKALRIYLPNNPVLIKFGEELDAKMAGHLARFGEFRLTVEPFALRYRGSEVYQNQDPKESLAFRIFSDGIRVLQFAPGIPLKELTEFLDIVAVERPDQNDDDIVTRLWEKGLPHVSYLVEDDFVTSKDAEAAEFGTESQQGALSELYRALNAFPLPPIRMIPKHLLMLTREEAGGLRQARQADALRDPLQDLITILSTILSGVKDQPENFHDFSRILAKLTGDLFLSGEFDQALGLLRFLDRLLKGGDLQPEQQEQLAAAIAGVVSEETLQALRKTIDEGDTVSQEQLRELLLILGLPALAAICELLGRIEKLKMRKVIIEVLIELGRDQPEVFAPFLSDPRWYLVRNVVLVLSLVGTPVAVNLIAGLISHREARIRKEVLGFLERSADPKARTYLLKFLRDDSSALRVRALKILARERLPFALRPILSLTGAEDFKHKELAEKKAIYEALGELGSEQMIPLFRDMLLKKSWFRRAQPRESAILAVAGLLKVRSASARELLLEVQKHGTPEVRGIVTQALEEAASGARKSAA